MPASCLLFVRYLLRLLFDPEEGGSTFLLNFSEVLSGYTASHLFLVTAVRTSDPTDVMQITLLRMCQCCGYWDQNGFLSFCGIPPVLLANYCGGLFLVTR
jgi:hypothetical protein